MLLAATTVGSIATVCCPLVKQLVGNIDWPINTALPPRARMHRRRFSWKILDDMIHASRLTLSVPTISRSRIIFERIRRHLSLAKIISKNIFSSMNRIIEYANFHKEIEGSSVCSCSDARWFRSKLFRKGLKKVPMRINIIKHVTTILLLIKYPTIDVHSIYLRHVNYQSNICGKIISAPNWSHTGHDFARGNVDFVVIYLVIT